MLLIVYTERMRQYLLSAILVFLVLDSHAQWVPWQVPTPTERLAISPTGATASFDNVRLAAGMSWAVTTEDQFKVANGNEFADGRYYINIIPFLSGAVVNVGLKYTNGSLPEDWFANTTPLQPYQSSHQYSTTLVSNGGVVTFRLYDRGDPPSTYYLDNSGNIFVTLTRITPGIAVKVDTVFFPMTKPGMTSVQLDSIQGYGLQGYSLNNVWMGGPDPTAFTVISQRTVPFSLKDQTNEFEFTFRPTTIGRYEGHFHLHSPSAFGSDTDRIIYLIGESAKADISVTPDTLDFGTIPVSTSKTLKAAFFNKGNAAGTVLGAVLTPATMPFSINGFPVSLDTLQQGTVDVTFSPLAQGQFIARYDAAIDDGSVVTFYVKGRAGLGIPFYTTGDTIDFGKVMLGRSQQRQTTFRNIGIVDLNVTRGIVTDPIEYQVTTGNIGTKTYSPAGEEAYTFTFTPTVHLPNEGIHSGQFILEFTDQPSKVLYFVGRDHEPITTEFFIRDNYYVKHGEEVTVQQLLLSDLRNTLLPVQSLQYSIVYDASMVDLLEVTKGALISGADWTLNRTITPGKVDVVMSSTVSRLGGPGELLKLRFRAKTNVPSGSATDLVQTSLVFPDVNEPLATVSNGRIIIHDICSPVHTKSGQPGTFIEQNSPNPFNPTTRIRYAVGGNEPQFVSLELYDALGRFVRSLVSEQQEPGYHIFILNADDLPSGVYYYKYTVGSITKTRSLILAK